MNPPRSLPTGHEVLRALARRLGQPDRAAIQRTLAYPFVYIHRARRGLDNPPKAR